MTAIERIDGLLRRLEADHGGAVHPIRAVPLDIVAVEVAKRLPGVPSDDACAAIRAMATATDTAVAKSLLEICHRYHRPRDPEPDRPDPASEAQRLAAAL